MAYIEDNCSINSRQIETLIGINFFDEFGHNKKLLNIYKEFTGGKNRYNKTLKDKTKETRLLLLKEFENLQSNDKYSVWDQINLEQEVLGYVQVKYDVDKRYIYVQSIDERFSPRIECHSLATGKSTSLKVQKKLFENNMFRGGDILYVKSFKEKPAVKFVNGQYVEDETNKQWWISDFRIVEPEEFDKLILWIF